MSNTALVSIIIPVYNRADLIGDTLNSIIDQSYVYWECIIVDDGSTDATEDVLADYINKDTRFKFYKRPADRPKGGNASRNFGLKQSQGDYIMWYDSDDVMLPKKIEAHLSLFKASSDIDATVTKSYLYNFKTKNPHTPWRPVLFSDNLLYDFINLEAGWQTGDVLWKREALKNLRFNEALISFQDWEFHIKAIALDTHFKFNDTCYSYIRYTSNSIKNTKSVEKQYSDFLARNSVFKTLKKTNKINQSTALLLLNDYYCFFEQFSFKKQLNYAFHVLKAIVHLTFYTKRYKKFFRQFAFVYPVKFFKQLF